MNDSTGWLLFGVLALAVAGVLHDNIGGVVLGAVGAVLMLVGAVAKGVTLGMREFEDQKSQPRS